MNQVKGDCLFTRTKELLANYEGTQLDIYTATRLQPTWVSAVSTGRMKEPSVIKVQRLYEFLSGKPLKL